MSNFNPRNKITPRVIATDLDGTLIPLPAQPDNLDSLKALKLAICEKAIPLIFATGRHFESVLEAIAQYDLPLPEWIICDVGSTIYKQSGSAFEIYQPYEKHLTSLSQDIDRATVEELLEDIEGLSPQPEAHQQRFKISFESGPDDVEAAVERISQRIETKNLPYSVMGSLDPFAGIGLIDVLPKGVSKAYALIWLSSHADFLPDEVIYSGDSGNDLAALICGFRATVVANASPELAEKVRTHLAERQLENRMVATSGTATTGVLQGCRHFGLI